jgi:hypothetical protein
LRNRLNEAGVYLHFISGCLLNKYGYFLWVENIYG